MSVPFQMDCLVLHFCPISTKKSRTFSGPTCETFWLRTTVYRIRIAFMFFLCSHWGMNRLAQNAIADALLSAPGWGKLGLTYLTRTRLNSSHFCSPLIPSSPCHIISSFLLLSLSLLFF